MEAEIQHKFQMVLPEELGVRLRAVAVRKRIPLARFIRETMEKRVEELENESPLPSLAERLKALGSHVMETDLSTRVDEILYGSGDTPAR